MEITHVKIFPVQEDKLKAFVSVVFDNCFMVNDIKIIQGKDGLFLSMPSRRKKTGEFKDVAHPLNSETRLMLEERVLREYRREVDDTTPRRPDHDHDEGSQVATKAAASSGSAGGTESGDSGSADDGPAFGRPRGPASNGSSGSEAAAPERVARPVDDTEPGDGPAARVAESNGSSRDGEGTVRPAEQESREPSLKEVEEKILQDSFWSRPLDRS